VLTALLDLFVDVDNILSILLADQPKNQDLRNEEKHKFETAPHIYRQSDKNY